MSSEEGEMAANLRLRRRRGCPRSPAAAPLDADDLLSEILLRLPPQPSSLPRASLVCRRWRSLVSDPGFVRRFRFHHRRNPAVLGCFVKNNRAFVPTLEAPNRVPPGRFSWQSDDGKNFLCVGCRHGLVLIFLPRRIQFLVWDPVTGDEHRLAVPPGFSLIDEINGTVLRAAGDVHFRVVLVGCDKQGERALTRVYSSVTGSWGDFISTLLPSEIATRTVPAMDFSRTPAVLIGDSLYWLVFAGSLYTIEFDLARQSLTVTLAPVDMFLVDRCSVMVMRAEGGEIGFLVRSDFTAQLWKRKTDYDYDGVTLWVLEKTIELDKLLHINSKKEIVRMAGFTEENNVVFLRTFHSVFMVELESLQFKELFKTDMITPYHPLEIVYTAVAETGMGGGDNGTELLHNA